MRMTYTFRGNYRAFIPQSTPPYNGRPTHTIYMTSRHIMIKQVSDLKIFVYCQLRSLAKQGDNRIGSVCAWVCPFISLCMLSCRYNIADAGQSAICMRPRY